ncbi:MAG TPA: hypothetical protein DCW58_04160 [Candidatus Pacebacteria bacterium]|nr:hypothetical protein [Candidatus Paceibacterota bacterium]
MGAFKLPGYYISDPVFLQNKKQLVRKMQSEFRTMWYERCKANFGENTDEKTLHFPLQESKPLSPGKTRWLRRSHFHGNKILLYP